MSDENLSEEASELADLKNEAASLKITHNANIGAAKLKEKIEAYYVSQEGSGDKISELVDKNLEGKKEEDTTPEKSKVTGGTNRLDPAVTKRKAREKAAKKTRIVTIIDNDQRQNMHTSTCSVNCSNQFFDLGTVHLPLGEKIEVAQGHINVLKEVYIPIHTRDPKTGLSITKTRPRYSISFEDVQ